MELPSARLDRLAHTLLPRVLSATRRMRPVFGQPFEGGLAAVRDRIWEYD